MEIKGIVRTVGAKFRPRSLAGQALGAGEHYGPYGAVGVMAYAASPKLRNTNTLST